MYEINTWAVVVAAAVYVVLGALWYSQRVFGKTWMHLSGMTKEDMGKPGPALTGSVVVSLITAYTLAKLFKYTFAATGAEVMQVTLLVWIGLIMAPTFNDVLYGKKPRKLWLLNGFYQLFAMVLAALILVSWK